MGIVFSSPATTPGGLDGQVQYNNSNAFGGSSGITLTATQATLASPIITGSATFNGATSGTVAIHASATGGNAVIGNLTITNPASALTAVFPKMYVALLTQFGTDAPVATVIVNTLGGTVVWTRTDIGEYDATLSGAFPVDKVIAPGTVIASDTGTALSAVRLSSNVMHFVTGNSGGTTDSVLIATPVIIEIYP
jgi:hypothetical protein